MSLAIYPVFDRDLSEALKAYFKGAGGEILADSFEKLDEVADAHGLVRFTAFADQRPIPEGFDGSPEDLKEIMGPSNRWYSCREGIAAFEALAKLISTNPRADIELDDPEDVVQGLQELARTLAAGEAKNAQFRLELC